MEETATLAKYATHVTVIHRRDTFRATAATQKKALSSPNVSVLWNTEVTEVVGAQNLEKLILTNNKDNTKSELEVDGLFIAIGHVPSTAVYSNQLELDERGYVKKIPSEKFEMSTSIAGVFVSGDVHDIHYRQAITAAGFGCMAGMDALKYLGEK